MRRPSIKEAVKDRAEAKLTTTSSTPEPSTTAPSRKKPRTPVETDHRAAGRRPVAARMTPSLRDEMAKVMAWEASARGADAPTNKNAWIGRALADYVAMPKPARDRALSRLPQDLGDALYPAEGTQQYVFHVAAPIREDLDRLVKQEGRAADGRRGVIEPRVLDAVALSIARLRDQAGDALDDVVVPVSAPPARPSVSFVASQEFMDLARGACRSDPRTQDRRPTLTEWVEDAITAALEWPQTAKRLAEKLEAEEKGRRTSSKNSTDPGRPLPRRFTMSQKGFDHLNRQLGEPSMAGFSRAAFARMAVAAEIERTRKATEVTPVAARK